MRPGDGRALAVGGFLGAIIAAGGLVAMDLASRPPPFSISDVALPTGAVPATATPRAALPLVLQPDGLGVVSFGEDGQSVLTELTELLGPPDTREQLRCADPDAEVQVTGWADLTVLLFDGVFQAFGSGLHYPPTYGPPLGLRTREGLEIGAPVGSLAEVYGDRVDILAPEPLASGDERSPRRFVIDGGEGLRGLVLDMGAGEQVIVIAAGAECVESAP